MSKKTSASKALKSNTTPELSVIIQRNRMLFVTFLTLLIVYSGFTLLPQPQTQILNRYGLSALGVRVIYVTIILLFTMIWGMAFYGYVRLKDYANLIQGQKDGRHVKTIANGIFFLSLWLPVSECVSVVLRYFDTRHPGLLPVFTIIANYFNLGLPLAAFILIGRGARGLNSLVKQNIDYRLSALVVLIVSYIGVIYAHLSLTASYRIIAYQMSIWPVLMTIIAPYIFMWFTGGLAALEIFNYQRKVSGILYKKSWGMLALGTGWLIVTSVIFQFLTTLSIRLQSLSVYWLLLIVYSLLVVLSVGFMFIAIGTARLKMIEEA